jgi:hypothetical protein
LPHFIFLYIRTKDRDKLTGTISSIEMQEGVMRSLRKAMGDNLVRDFRSTVIIC